VWPGGNDWCIAADPVVDSRACILQPGAGEQWLRCLGTWRYNAPGGSYAISGLVLEHRIRAGYFLFVPHSVHTPGKGGFTHIGISTFAKKGLWWQWVFVSEAGIAMDTLQARRWVFENLYSKAAVGNYATAVRAFAGNLTRGLMA
jgi:hypothetical protein